MNPIAAIALGLKIVEAARDALAAGRTEITDEQLDAAFAEIAESDAQLTAAIERARARREARGG